MKSTKLPCVILVSTLAAPLLGQTASAVAQSSAPPTEASLRSKRLAEIRTICHTDKASSADAATIRLITACVQRELKKDDEAAVQLSAKKSQSAALAQRKDREKALAAEQKKQLDKLLDPHNTRNAGAFERLQSLDLVGSSQIDTSANQESDTAASSTSPSPGNPKSASVAPPGAGTEITESRYGTKTACGPLPKGATSTSNHPDQVGVTVAMMMPKEAADMFGRRLGKRYVVYQVRVSNKSTTLQYAVHDISVDLSPVLTANGRTTSTGYGSPQMYLASSRELSLLRGVPEKGEDLDPRNLSLHVLQGVGSVAASVSGLTPFQDVMGGAVAVFAGPFLQSFVTIAPDHTATQQNRLSDSAFASNTLVDKLHTKVFSIFVPQPMALTRGQQQVFWDDPQRLLSGGTKVPSKVSFWKSVEYLDSIPLDSVNVCVDGTLLQVAQSAQVPQLSPNVEELSAGSKIGFAAVPDGTTIHYSLNDTDPAEKFMTYSAPFLLSAGPANAVIRAFTTSNGLPQSDMLRRVISVHTVAAPTITPTNDDSVVGDPIAMTSDTQGADIYFTTDGSQPDSSKASEKFIAGTTNLIVANQLTVKAFAVKAGLQNSALTSVTFSPKTPAPTTLPAPGAIASGSTVTLSGPTGSKIYYTEDGSTPTTSSPVYTGPIAVTKAETIKAIAIVSGLRQSDITSVAYTLQ